MRKNLSHPIRYLCTIMQTENNTNLCPNCHSDFSYPDNENLVCTQCFHEWNPAIIEKSTEEKPVVDVNGQVLQNGDTVALIKDLPVKGGFKPLKTGTKVKNIRLVDSDHNIECKIEGYGAMALKSEFVKKA